MRRPGLGFLLLALAGVLDAAAGTYPMEGGSLRREGRAISLTGAAAPINLIWSTTLCGATPRGNPVVLEESVVQTFQTRLSCVSRTSGTMLWKWDSFGVGDMWNPPAYDASRNRLYQSTLNGGVVALRATDGMPQWSLMEGGHPGVMNWASVTYDSNLIYFGNANMSLVCINADTQAEIWRHNFSVPQGCVSPAIDGGFIYLAGDHGEVACRNQASGALQWVRQGGVGANFMSAILLTNTHLYLMCGTGKVECRRRSDGLLDWTYQTASWTMSNMSLGDNALYVTSDDRCIHKLDLATGALHWKKCFSGNFARSAPFYAGGLVFASGCTSEYYAVDNCGNTVWAHNHGIDNSFVDWAEADGRLYVSNFYGILHCFQPSWGPGPLACPPTPTFSPSPVFSPSPTRTQTPSFSPTGTPSSTPSATPTPTPTWTASGTPTWSASPTRSSSPSRTASPTLSFTVTPSVTASGTPTLSTTASATATLTQTATPTPQATSTAAPGQLPEGHVIDGLCDDCGAAYPNPARGDHVRVGFRMKQAGNARVRVFSAAAEQAYGLSVAGLKAGDSSVELDIREFAPGVYFFIVDRDYASGRKEGTHLAKFIRIR